jgi:poly-gamma-glutamate capsule biosynthesis protein CapA/YwtB (metallophosphatase superfamily)
VAPTIGLLGDVMLGRAVGERIDHGSPHDVWAPEVRELCRSCDVLICNLECCISGRGRPTERIRSKPFHFRGPPEAVRSLDAIAAGAAGLANNHALDYEDEALFDTLRLLDGAGIAIAGAGGDEAEARQPVLLEASERRVGVVAVSDHPAEFAAGPHSPGIAYADLSRGVPDWVGDRLAAARAEQDLVIAFVHWGPNMTAAPSRSQRSVAAEFQEAGADLVAGHSAHVFHGVGWGDPGPRLFDLGDALDDYAVDPRLRNDLGVMALWRPGDSEAELELVGLTLDFCHTRLATGDDAQWIATRLKSACGELGTRVERVAEQRFRVTPA